MKIVNPSFIKTFISWPRWNLSPENHIALTFDDGPHPEFTLSALHILKDFEVKATFFLTGEKVVRFPGIVERIIKDGHIIGNHGFTHTPLIFKKKKYIFQEIDKTAQAIESITGEIPILFRPPHGWFDFRFKKIMQQRKMVMVLWSLLSYDFIETNGHHLFLRITNNIRSGDIIVLHDGHENASLMLQTLPEILTWIKEKKLTINGIY